MRNLLLFFFIFLAACGQEYELGNIQHKMAFTPGTSVDALVVLDTSCSMMSDQEHVLAGALAIGADLWDMDLDAQLAFTSSDGSKEGWEEVDLEQEIVEVVLDTSDAMFSLPGDSTEAGMDSAITALDNNFDFFRYDSIKLVIFVSDEHEQSDLTADDFRMFWGFDRTFIMSVSGDPEEEYTQGPSDPSDIFSGSCSTEATPKYVEAADIAINLCRDAPWRVKDLLPQ